MNSKILVLSVFLITNMIWSQAYLGDNKLVIDGNAKLVVESDRGSFTYKVIGYGSNLREAVSDAKQKISRSTMILKTYGINQNDISTSLFMSGENRGGSAFLSSSEDYVTTINISVILDSLSLLEDIILKLSESDVDEISNIQFSLKDYSKYEEQVRNMATQNAKDKAEKIAKDFGVEILKVIYIGESSFNQGYPNPFNPSTEKGLPSELVGSFYNKPVKLNSKIKVVYAIK